MAIRKAPSLTKPSLDTSKVLDFAEARSSTVAASGQIPEGDKRLTANIRADLHKKLKLAAVDRDTTIGELLEKLIEQGL